jgi:hypothetical protein
MKDAKDQEGRSVKILGKAGVLYRDKDGEFFIDSEILVSPPFDLVIFSDGIGYSNNPNGFITEEKKKEIIVNAVRLFESIGMKVEVG